MNQAAGGTEMKKDPGTIYRDLETWWGEKLNDDLINRMSNAPLKHQQQFVEYFQKSLRKNLSTIPELQPKILRPMIGANAEQNFDERRLAGLRLLLYAHEIVVDVLDYLNMVTPKYGVEAEGDHSFVAVVKRLAQIRPLVEDGSIRFVNTTPMLGTTSFDRLLESPAVSDHFNAVMAPLESFAKLRGLNWSKKHLKVAIYTGYCMGIHAGCVLAEEHLAHALARSPLEDAIMRAYLQRPVTSKYHTVLQKLAALNVPTLTSNLDTLVRLRQSDPDFADWRTRLGEAISYVEDLREDEASLKEASDIVYGQLSDGLSQVEKAVKKSPVLQAVKGGVTGLAITGISAATTAGATALMSGNIGVGLAAGVAGGVAGKISDSGLAYVKALEARRQGRLILDVAMLFDSSKSK
jgi:hypothetical protein